MENNQTTTKSIGIIPVILWILVLGLATLLLAQYRGWIPSAASGSSAKPPTMERYTLLTDANDPKGVGEFVTVGTTSYVVVACTVTNAEEVAKDARERIAAATKKQELILTFVGKSLPIAGAPAQEKAVELGVPMKYTLIGIRVNNINEK